MLVIFRLVKGPVSTTEYRSLYQRYGDGIRIVEYGANFASRSLLTNLINYHQANVVVVPDDCLPALVERCQLLGAQVIRASELQSGNILQG